MSAGQPGGETAKGPGGKFRIAAVSYLNSAPLLAGLADDPEIELVRAIPAEVTRRLAEGEADVGLLPVASAATLGEMDLLDLGIAAAGAVRSVVVVSETPIEALERVWIDASSRTSVVLTKLELAARGAPCASSRNYPSAPPEFALAQVKGRTGALIIGDRAIDLAAKFPYSLDLAEAYRARTGRPFVFATWAARRGTWARAWIERLLRAAESGLASRDEIAATYAASRVESDVGRYASYLHEAITYRLGSAEQQGLMRFYDEAARAGLLPVADVQPVSSHPLEEGRLGWGHEAPATRNDTPSVDTLLERAADGARLSHHEALRIYRQADLFALGLAADAIRRRKNAPEVVTYIVDRNVNYTNVCTTSCRFCAFYRPPGHDEGYTLSREQLAPKLQEVVDAGGIQILLQGGLNPALRLSWYEDLFGWIKSTYGLGLHALSPEEILHIAQLEGLDVSTVLARLHRAGLDSVPGGGAEILVDRVRRHIAKAKCTSEEWLSVMRAAHHQGLRSSCTMMYGTTDTDDDRISHLMKLRNLQDETGGFTAFFCWDFQYERGTRIAPGDHGTLLYLRTQAIARLVLDNVDHIGSSWVTQGPSVGQLALRFGADDWGSVMFEENVVSSAGTTFRLNAQTIENLVHDAGYAVVRRDVHYRHLGAAHRAEVPG